MSDDESRTQSISFEVGPDTRTTHEASVAAFDAALAAAVPGEVMHFIDPTRINAFISGGPPVWSVGSVCDGDSTLYLTYGFSSAIDPARMGSGFELSIRVPGPSAMWPGLLLRALARYMLTSHRELEIGQYMPFPEAITRFFAPPDERDELPTTSMQAACFIDDPDLPRIETPHGVATVRRVVGLMPEELHLMELWSTPAFLAAVAQRDPQLLTDIERAPLTQDTAFVDAIDAGSKAEGSSFGYVAVPGMEWDGDNGLEVKIPGGAHAARIHRMIQARLPFGRHLLVQDMNPANPRTLVFEPADEAGARVEGDTLVLQLPNDHELIGSLLQDNDAEIRWKLG